MLTDIKIKKAQPAEKQYRMADSGGLCLIIFPNGSKRWRFRYRFQGKERDFAIGTYPQVSLADARKARDEAKEQLKLGNDPTELKQMKKLSNLSFAAIAEEWLEKMSPQWVPKHCKKISSHLKRHIIPYIGNKALDDIKAPHIVEPLNVLQKAGLFESAKQVRGVINQVFGYAVQIGATENNPAFAMRGVIAAPKVRHMPAFTTPKQLGRFLRNVDVYEGSYIVKSALRFLPLVFVRPGELRHAEWKEIDFENAEWRIPAEKMKMKEEHVVPLARQALEILSDLKKITGTSRYLFPSARTYETPMSENAVNVALRTMGYQKGEVTGHGFRATASTLLNELGFFPDIIERQLAHAERNKVKSAYNRASHLDKRREMMQQWADYLDSLKHSND